MVDFTDTYLIDDLITEVALCEVIEREGEVVYVSFHEVGLFETIRILIESPCEH